MTPTEVAAFLRAHEGKRVLVTWENGESQRVDINAVDEEGFLHSGPDGTEQRDWWTRFEDVAALEIAAAVEGSDLHVVEGTFILQAVYAAGARDDGPRAHKYRGRLVDCVRVYARTLNSQAAGVGIDCWKLGANGAFESFRSPVSEGESPPPFQWGPVGEVEDLGPVEPVREGKATPSSD